MSTSRLTWPIGTAIIFFALQCKAFTPSSYLDSLNRGVDPADESDSSLTPFGMPAEEYFGQTNPMANNWPGSKHQEYGGYLNRLDGGHRNLRKKDDNNDEWYGKSNPMASWQGYKDPKYGGYLDTLQAATGDVDDVSRSTLPPGKPSDYGVDVRWGVDVYLNSIQNKDTTTGT